MLTIRILLMTMLAVSAGFQTAHAQAEPRPGSRSAPRKLADESFKMACLLSAVSISGAMAVEGRMVDPGLVHPQGLYIWTQPGAGLVASLHADGLAGKDELFYDPAMFSRMLEALPSAVFSVPLVFPTEEQYNLGLPLDTVHILNADQAQTRLQRYMDGFDQWSLAMSEDGEFQEWRQYPDLLLKPDAAIVFMTAEGPLEFHFMRDNYGDPYLTNIIWFDFFSA